MTHIDAGELDALATGAGTVVEVHRGPDVLFERAHGLADRAHGIPATVDTEFAIASGTKGFTALAVAGLLADGALSLSTTARSVLGTDLPLVPDDVTVEHLLAHRSGIGDYVDEDAGGDVPPNVPVQTLVRTTDYLAALDGFGPKFPAGARFSYCNSGFVVLALIAERVAQVPFHDLVAQRVFAPAGMTRTAFLRSDRLPGTAAIGYLEDGRTNVFHVPLRGNGDGGAYTSLEDLRAFWRALFDGRIVSEEWVARLVRPRSEVPREHKRYGLGFWLAEAGPAVILEGMDYGVSFRSRHDPTTGHGWSVIANTSGGAWPIARRLELPSP